MSSAAGAVSVAVAVVAFGSFGVPIKSKAVVAAQVDPVIFQCYKTFACFCTSWLVLAFVNFRFTWWGLAGGAVWVVNGTGAIIAIRLAGLSISQALWSGLSIFISFVWGVAVFHEHVASIPLALTALSAMALGMTGLGLATTYQLGRQKASISSAAEESDDEIEREALINPPQQQLAANGGSPSEAVELQGCQLPAQPTLLSQPPQHSAQHPAQRQSVPQWSERRRYLVGLACAMYVGVANGSFMVPLKYANREVKGAEYLVSFGIGSAVVTALVLGSYSAALTLMRRPVPSFQLRVAAGPALCTGLLWSAGNAASILATESLGMAVAWPLVQCNLIVSSLWGIFYYGEVRGRGPVGGFFGATGVVLIGVLLLSLSR